jgi:hypothetical protein
LRQLTTASCTYITDNGRPLARENPAYRDARWAGSLIDYYKVNEVRVCPAAPFRKAAPPQNGQGTADTAWVRWTNDSRVMFYGSYGFNGWFYDVQKRKDFQFFMNREVLVEVPSQTPVFMDSNWADMYPLEENNPAQDLYAGRSLYAQNNDIGRCTIVRHGSLRTAKAPRHLTNSQALPGAIQMGFYYGHIELVKLAKLWTLAWHHNWQNPTTIPTPMP